MRTCCRRCSPPPAIPTSRRSCSTGKTIGDRTYKVHLDGYDLAPALKGEGEWPRKEFLYWTDDGSVAALRYDNWKITFLEQNARGLEVWQEPFEELRAPTLTNLRMDPFERAEEENAMGYQRWYIERMFADRSGGRLCRATGCRASGNSRRARSRAASTSTG